MKIKFNKCAVLSIHCDKFSIHFGVYPERDQEYYKMKGDREVVVQCDWIWGHATEMYDHCVEYFGLGPFLLVCW